MGVSSSVDPDQGRRSVGLGLDPDCLHVNSLNISEEMLDASQENCCCFHYINISVTGYAINIVIYLMLNKYIIVLYCISLVI